MPIQKWREADSGFAPPNLTQDSTFPGKTTPRNECDRTQTKQRNRTRLRHSREKAPDFPARNRGRMNIPISLARSHRRSQRCLGTCKCSSIGRDIGSIPTGSQSQVQGICKSAACYPQRETRKTWRCRCNTRSSAEWIECGSVNMGCCRTRIGGDQTTEGNLQLQSVGHVVIDD